MDDTPATLDPAHSADATSKAGPAAVVTQQDADTVHSRPTATSPPIVPAGDRQAGPGSSVGAGQVFRWCASGALAVLMVGLAAAAVYTMWPVLVQAIVAVFIAVSLRRTGRPNRS